MDYQKSGVNIEAGDQAVELIKDRVAQTFNKNVLNPIGGFAALYELPKYKNPVLVSCTDGVGTKLMLAIETGIFNTVGIDLVAMSINDLICCGAKPLFFLDYVAVNTLKPVQMKEIIDGIIKGCLESGCALIGGEMAEMNEMYQPGDFDLAGFAVGLVEKDEIIDGRNVKAGDNIYALASSGVHSNGYSLVRKVLNQAVCEKHGFSYKELLTPTIIYYRAIEDLKKQATLKAISHITGGGIEGNLSRVIPAHVDAVIEKAHIRTPKVFKLIQEIGPVEEKEMWTVFNMGVGMIVVTDQTLKETESCYKIGQIKEGHGAVKLV